MKKAIALVCMITIGISVGFAGGAKDKEVKEDTMMAPKDAMTSDNSMSSEPMKVDPSKAVFNLTGLGPAVVPYEGEDAAQKLAATKRVVYFFAADWCPTCKATYDDLKVSAMKAPEDLVIVVVNFDKEIALKKKYGITYQHTYVAIGPKGEELKVWAGSRTIAEIEKQMP